MKTTKRNYSTSAQIPYFDYLSDEWIVEKRRTLFAAHYKCEQCAITHRKLVVHHVIPLANDDNFGIWYNQDAIYKLLNLSPGKKLLVLCVNCHRWIHKKLRSPEFRLYERRIKKTDEVVFIGFIDGNEVSYCPDVRRSLPQWPDPTQNKPATEKGKKQKPPQEMAAIREESIQKGY